MLKVKPDLNIGPEQLYRWHLIPKNRIFNIYLHKILKSDEARALHDHPWWSLSIPLSGQMHEVNQNGLVKISKWVPAFRKATHQHRLIVKDPVWTLFITGRVVRKWGFWPNGVFVPYRKFLNSKGN